MEPIAKHEKELIIKFKVNQLKKLAYGFLVIFLLSMVILQYVYPNCNKCGLVDSVEESSNDSVDLISEEVISTPSVSEVIIELNDSNNNIDNESSNSDNVSDFTNSSEINNSSSDEESDEPLPITGEVFLTIDEVNHVIKGEDYARVVSVTYTIKNQDVDFTPKLRAYLTSDSDDMKEVTLSTLDAGDSITQKETKFTFGYKDISETHTLKIQIYKGSKLLKTSTKAFETN